MEATRGKAKRRTRKIKITYRTVLKRRRRDEEF